MPVIVHDRRHRIGGVAGGRSLSQFNTFPFGASTMSEQPAASSRSTLNDDSLTQFYIEAHRIVTEARFIISSFPNAERIAV